MTEDTIAWLQSAHGHGLLAMIHMGGMAFAAGAAVLGYGIAALLLYGRGRQPAPIVINILHGLIAISLVVLWLTGGALVVGRMSLTELPTIMVFKLGVAALLSFSVWAEHAMTRPWLLSARRPLAANLGWGQLIGIATIGGLSLSCWAMLIAGKYLPELQALPLNHAFALLGLAVGLIAAGCLALACVTRARQSHAQSPKTRPSGRSRTAQKKRQDGRRRQPATARQSMPQPTGAHQPVAQLAGVQQPVMQRSPIQQQLTRLRSPRPSPSAPAAIPGPHPASQSAPAPVVLLAQQPTSTPATAPVSLRPVDEPSPIATGTTYQVPQGRNDEAEQLRYKLAQEWLRCTPARPASSGWNTAPADPDDQLLHAWLRRP